MYKFISSLLLLLILASCSKSDNNPLQGSHGQQNADKNKAFFEETGTISAYTTTGPNAQTLDCSTRGQKKEACTFTQLNLLGVEKARITIQDVLDRTLVTHKFLGDNFKKFLENSKSDNLLQMFGSVSAIIISDKVKPSFFWGKTGAIYLSADFFWLTESEYKELHKSTDPRSDFGRKFKFDIFGKKTINGVSIYRLANKRNRNIDDINPSLSRVLFHELTHANDYFPRHTYTRLANYTGTYLDFVKELFEQEALVSENFDQPLESQVIKNLARVSFRGAQESDAELIMEAYEVAEEFKRDFGVAYYSYSSTREDLAMLMETLLMMKHFNMESSVAVVKYPENNFKVPSGYSYPIAWGEKNRILKNEIFERALYGASVILKNYNESSFRLLQTKFKIQEFPEGMSYRDI